MSGSNEPVSLDSFRARREVRQQTVAQEDEVQQPRLPEPDDLVQCTYCGHNSFLTELKLNGAGTVAKVAETVICIRCDETFTVVMVNGCILLMQEMNGA